MQVRILELRNGGPSSGTSEVSQGIKSAVVPVFGGGARGMNESGDRARDIARLGAMNDLLKQRNCPHYDLTAELAQPVSGPSPRLIKPGKP